MKKMDNLCIKCENLHCNKIDPNTNNLFNCKSNISSSFNYGILENICVKSGVYINADFFMTSCELYKTKEDNKPASILSFTPEAPNQHLEDMRKIAFKLLKIDN